MNKLPIPIAHDISPSRRKRSLLRTAAIVVLGVSLAPLIAEATTLCYVQWCEVMGKSVKVNTPLFDAMQDSFESGHRSTWSSISSFYQHVPWDPAVVLPIGAVVTLLAISMLKC